MNTIPWTESLLEIANFVVALGANLLVQSTLLIAPGLLAAHLCRRKGAALQSLIRRVTLVAILVCPLATYLLSAAGIEGVSLALPKAAQYESVATPLESPATQSTTLPSASTEFEVASNPPREQGTAESEDGLAQASDSAGSQSASNPMQTAPSLTVLDADKPLNRLSLLYCVLAISWVAGAVVLVVPLLACHVRISRLRWQAGMADVEVFERCQSIARELNVVPPEVLSHAEVKSPLLVGLFRPAILLPRLKEHLHIVASREVLLHELAHLARRDCLWHLLGRIATALLFFQPLLWLIVRGIEETAEEVCDNYVIEKTADRRSYVRQLANLAERLQFPRTEAAVGVGVIAFKSALGRRIVRILDQTRNLSTRSGTLANLGIVIVSSFATAVVGLIGIGVSTSALAAEAGGSGAVLKTVVSGSGTDAYGELSPDESKIAYIDWEHKEAAHLTVRDLASNRQWPVSRVDTNLTESWGFCDEPYAWSRDSRKLAFQWWVSGAKPELRIATVETGVNRVVVRDQAIQIFPWDWSPDGEQLLCWIGTSDGRPKALGLVHPESGAIRELVQANSHHLGHARFSPDSKSVVFEDVIDGNRDIFMIILESGLVTRLTKSPEEDGSPVWSEDGQLVVFSSYRRGKWSLYGIEIKNGQPNLAPFVIRSNFGDHDKRVTQLGKLSFNASTRELEAYYLTINSNNGEISAPTFIARPSPRGRAVSWSPDSKQLAYLNDNQTFSVKSVETDQEKTYKPGMERVNNVAWAPDGKTVSLSPRGPQYAIGIYRFDLETKELSSISKPQNMQTKGFTPDGESYVYMEHVAGHLMKVDLKTGQEQSILDRKQFPNRHAARDNPLLQFQLSTDSEKKEQSLILYDLAQGEQRTLISATSPEGIAAPWWAVGAKAILYRFTRSDGKHELRIVATDGSWRKTVNTAGLNPDKIEKKSLTPDGTVLAFTYKTDDNADELRVMSVDGRWQHVVDVGKWRQVRNFQWSPDGSKLSLTIEGRVNAEISLLENFLPRNRGAVK